MKPPTLRTLFGQPSFVLATSTVRAAVTRRGGHLGPVTFRFGRRAVQPFSVAPWWREKLAPGTPPLLRVLRGDFFCLPFGGNEAAFRGERHPPHGETANGSWRFERVDRSRAAVTLELSLVTKVRPGRVVKRVTLVPGQNVVYQEHLLHGLAGPMCLGHHAMLRYPDHSGAGRISTSARVHGQVFVEPMERPENRGYSLLRPGAVFDDLARVPTITGSTTDLSRYPARRGYEDLVILAASAAPNPLSARGLTTRLTLAARTPLAVRYIMGVVAIPRDFDRVRELRVGEGQITLVGTRRRAVTTTVDVSFLQSGCG